LDRSKEDGTAMKQAELNPLQGELARSQLAGAHPDSDMLTAFTEGRLLQRERQEVFAHLASCADCRELLSFAAEASGEPASEMKPYLVARRVRRALRPWVAWASVAAGILVVCSIGLLYRQRLDSKERATVAAEKAAASGPAETQHSGAIAQSSTQQGGGAQDGAAFAGAGPEAEIAGGPARPHWRIDDAGKVERSFGDGIWQAVLPDEKSKMRVVSVFNRDVWIGGENSRLYRSADSGATWSLVSLPKKNGSEHTIMHVRFRSSRIGAVEATDGTSWTTADGGASWN
jgi:hypothetical protein